MACVGDRRRRAPGRREGEMEPGRKRTRRMECSGRRLRLERQVSCSAIVRRVRRARSPTTARTRYMMVAEASARRALTPSVAPVRIHYIQDSQTGRVSGARPCHGILAQSHDPQREHQAIRLAFFAPILSGRGPRSLPICGGLDRRCTFRPYLWAASTLHSDY